jgi:L-lactate dehydrogenase
MRVGIIGVGAVGSAIAMALALRGPACEMILMDKNRNRAKGVATDMRYGLPLSSAVMVVDGDYEQIEHAELVIIAAGINEREGGATDRSDPQGRLRLLDVNARIFEDIIPKITAVAPQAIILIATNPPEPLVEISRNLAGHDLILSTSTYLDTLRFKFHLAQTFCVKPTFVDATVVGEHGTSSVFLWSSARVGGTLINDLLEQRQIASAPFRQYIEDEVRYANISIIEGIGASQFGIGIVAARLAEIILNDEKAVVPVGSYNQQYKTTVSLPSVVGRRGVQEVFWPEMSSIELTALEHGTSKLRAAVQGYVS